MARHQIGHADHRKRLRFHSKLEAGEELNLQTEIMRAEENPAGNLGRLRQQPDDQEKFAFLRFLSQH